MKIILYLTFVFLLNYSAFGQPNADFTVDRYNVCSGTSLALNNTSTGANFFEWKVEGNHYSFSQDTIVTLVESCYDLKEIKLIATDTLLDLSDSSSIVVEVFDTCFFHWNGDYLLCPGDTVTLTVNPEEIATQFVITPPHTLLSGCLACSSIEFILTTAGTSVDRTSTYFGGCTEVTSYHYICALGTDEETSRGKVKIFPNPTNQNVYIESERRMEKIFIYNAFGQILYKSNDMADFKTEIDISPFSIGIYYIRVRLETGKTTIEKIIKTE